MTPRVVAAGTSTELMSPRPKRLRGATPRKPAKRIKTSSKIRRSAVKILEVAVCKSQDHEKAEEARSAVGAVQEDAARPQMKKARPVPASKLYD